MDASSLDEVNIADIVRGLEAVDWAQLRLTARLSPADRVLAGMDAQAFAMSALRGTFHRRFPELSLAELNMKVLAHCTRVQMERR
jgi:hypothetical protein